ncbi:hypothetical protein AMAG_02501 [Allomyces macrogynus ATCC 38327]|uniref:Uncharacterized protein n=1 Tax=Allomyces macrogynus (strain ATCC 38327) TaxID=578462 RepID=A0A0L0S2A5_ALLM3|nr:hypothetical protein AMAG_02501 [Allomyces macrogynus ATCC 38327]|eukprot:KNE56722.1 hypothetical protein AMAG_02501 [Allomyces macrogynus ATCC 38327]
MLTHWLALCGPFRESRDNAYRLPTIDPASFSAILAHLANPSTWSPPVDLCLVIMLDALYLDLHVAVDACLATAAENVDDVESLEGVPVPLVMAIARRLDVPALARADAIIAAAGGDTRRVWLDHLGRVPDALDALHRVDIARIESVVAYLAPPVPQSALPTTDRVGDVIRAMALPATLTANDVAWIRTAAHRASRPVELILENGATVPTYVPPPAVAEKLAARRKVAAQYTSSRGKLVVDVSTASAPAPTTQDAPPDAADPSPPTTTDVQPLRVVASGPVFTLHPSTPSPLLAWPLTRLVIRSTPLSTAQLTNLCTWLVSTHCAVTHLALTYGTLDESGLTALLSSLARTPLHLDLSANIHQTTPSRGDKSLVHALRAWCRALPPASGIHLTLAHNAFLPALAMSLVATLTAHVDRFASLRVAHVPLAAALDASAVTPRWAAMTAVDLTGTRVHAPVLADIVARLAECATGLTDVRVDAASDTVVAAVARAVPGWTKLQTLSVTASGTGVLVAGETFEMLAGAVAGHRTVEVVDWTGLDVPEAAIGTVIAGSGRRMVVVLGAVGTRMHARLGKMVAAVGKGGREIVVWTGAGMVTNIRGARRR